MKFLCVPCDRPLELAETQEIEGGSISLVYGCPDCGYEVAMLTNPHETQVVSSLGVKIGGKNVSKCPFTGMVQEMTGDPAARPDGIPWTVEALARMDNVPDLVKTMVRSGIERLARQKGYTRVDDRVLDEAKDFFEGAGFRI